MFYEKESVDMRNVPSHIMKIQQHLSHLKQLTNLLFKCEQIVVRYCELD